MELTSTKRCGSRKAPECRNRAAVVFLLSVDGRIIRLERCAEHARPLRAALKSVLCASAWTEQPLAQEAAAVELVSPRGGPAGRRASV
jgi:hypothetical protein